MEKPITTEQANTVKKTGPFAALQHRNLLTVCCCCSERICYKKCPVKKTGHFLSLIYCRTGHGMSAGPAKPCFSWKKTRP